MTPHSIHPESFQDIANIEKITLDELMRYPHRCPEWANSVLDQMAGLRLVPHDKEDGVDVEFDAGFGMHYEVEIQQISGMLNVELYPIAGSDNEHGLLLLAPTGECYGWATNGNDLSYLGDVVCGVRKLGSLLSPSCAYWDIPSLWLRVHLLSE